MHHGFSDPCQSSLPPGYQYLTKYLIESWFTCTYEWIPAYIKSYVIDKPITIENAIGDAPGDAPANLDIRFCPVLLVPGVINYEYCDSTIIYSRQPFHGKSYSKPDPLSLEHGITLIPTGNNPSKELKTYPVDGATGIVVNLYEHLPSVDGSMQFLGERLDYYAHIANNNSRCL